MSKVVTTTLQLGASGTLANNFELQVPGVPDGTLTLQRQDGTDVITIANTGQIQVPAGFEAGTYTPRIDGGTSAGSGVYTNQVGSWQKIGKVLFVWGRVTWSSHTGTGETRVTLPFAAAAGPTGAAVIPIWLNNVTLGANSYGSALTVGGASYFVLYNNIVAGGGVTAQSVDAGGGDMFFSGNYLFA